MTCIEDLDRLGIRVIREEAGEVVVRGINLSLEPRRVIRARHGVVRRFWMAVVGDLLIRTEATH